MGAAEVFSQCEGIFTVRIRVNDGWLRIARMFGLEQWKGEAIQRMHVEISNEWCHVEISVHGIKMIFRISQFCVIWMKFFKNPVTIVYFLIIIFYLDKCNGIWVNGRLESGETRIILPWNTNVVLAR